MEKVEIYGKILHKTPDAILFHDGTLKVWLPKSQIDWGEPNKYGDVLVEMPEWLAIDKELV